MGKFDKFFEDDGSLKLGRAVEKPPVSVRGLPEGSWVDDGVYRVDRIHQLGAPYGRITLNRPEDMEVMGIFGARGSIVFLDLETTGLAGGTGTYAFLCGIGVSTEKGFKVMQYFLEGPSKESRWLKMIDSVIPRDASLVTYNGAAFDLPLLRTRHILSRSFPSWDGFPSIDLLYHARRFYKGRFESCSLGSVERHVLGVRRGGEDIPGYLIPGMYFRYLKTRDARSLGGVFYHNELDIVSLAALYCHVANVLNGSSEDGMELTRAGDIWMRNGCPSRAVTLWNKACGFPAARAEAYARKGFAAKRSSDFESARESFQLALESLDKGACTLGNEMEYVLLEELAKIEEHRFKSPGAAMERVLEAIEWLRKNRHLLGRSFARMNESMRQRAERLEKIIKKSKETNLI
jgi:uncharacterized protein YprB with RNaseH-like and TPR domain